MKNEILERLIFVPSDEEYKIIMASLDYDEINKNMDDSSKKLGNKIAIYNAEIERLTAVINKSNEFDLQSKNSNGQIKANECNIRKRDIILNKIREKKACIELIELYKKHINNEIEQKEYEKTRDAFLHSIIILRSEIYLNKERYIEYCLNNHFPIDYEWCEKCDIFIFGNRKDNNDKEMDKTLVNVENFNNVKSKLEDAKDIKDKLVRRREDQILPPINKKQLSPRDMLLFLVTIGDYISILIYEKRDNKSR